MLPNNYLSSPKVLTSQLLTDSMESSHLQKKNSVIMKAEQSLYPNSVWRNILTLIMSRNKRLTLTFFLSLSTSKQALSLRSIYSRYYKNAMTKQCTHLLSTSLDTNGIKTITWSREQRTCISSILCLSISIYSEQKVYWWALSLDL